jgi:transposase
MDTRTVLGAEPMSRAIDPAPGGVKPRKMPRTISPAVLMQTFADGMTVDEVAMHFQVSIAAVHLIIRKLRAQYSIRTTHQLVAHFLRNGWID